MDRPIKKKKWTAKRILTLGAIAVFAFFLIYLLFIRDKQSRLYVNEDQLSIAVVLEDKFQEFIPTDGIVFPKNTVYIDAVTGGIVEAVHVELAHKGRPVVAGKVVGEDLGAEAVGVKDDKAVAGGRKVDDVARRPVLHNRPQFGDEGRGRGEHAALAAEHGRHGVAGAGGEGNDGRSASRLP